MINAGIRQSVDSTTQHNLLWFRFFLEKHKLKFFETVYSSYNQENVRTHQKAMKFTIKYIENTQIT